MHDTNSLPTVGEIARRLDKPLHRVEYVIRSRGIEPVSIAGNSRVFSEAQVQLIASELRRIDEDRGVQPDLDIEGQTSDQTIDSVADLILENEQRGESCECGRPATHQHVDLPRSINQPMCDYCCDKNCNYLQEQIEKLDT